jgi:uncharacterized repeat protein (TIGR03843 family)
VSEREIDAARARTVLATGEIDVLGYLPYASNATLLGHVRLDDDDLLAVYKPRRGETPLWDFPDGTLCLREYAAWVVDEALGWGLVPPTVLRDGPAGFGAVQLFVEEDPEADIRQLPVTHPDALRCMSLFDIVVNNADRKAGHCIVDTTGRLWAVDHGIAFHEDPKLRTVVWAFAGEPIPRALLDDLSAFCASEEPWTTLEELLDGAEIDALRRRIAAVLRVGRFPAPGPGRNVPWPPW